MFEIKTYSQAKKVYDYDKVVVILFIVLFMIGVLINHIAICTNTLWYDISLVWMIVIFIGTIYYLWR